MSMHQRDFFPNEDGSHDRQRPVKCWQSVLHEKWSPRNVINPQSMSHVSHARSISIRMRQNHHLVSQLQQALRKTVYMTLHTSKVGVEEITHHQDPMPFPVAHEAVRIPYNQSQFSTQESTISPRRKLRREGPREAKLECSQTRMRNANRRSATIRTRNQPKSR